MEVTNRIILCFGDDSLSCDDYYIAQLMEGSPFGYSVRKSIQWKYGFFFFSILVCLWTDDDHVDFTVLCFTSPGKKIDSFYLLMQIVLYK